MNKCMYCKYSCPTGNIGGYKCDYADWKNQRQIYCIDAIKEMKQYNEIRSNIKNNITKEE